MQDQKLENQLNLALSATPEEREKSNNLNVGYDSETNTWDIIVKYSGDILSIIDDSIQVVPLLNNYAIVTLPEERITEISSLPIIEYVEKPKQLFFSVVTGKSASCITPMQTSQYHLFGRDVIVAVIDSGIDYSHLDFRNPNGTTRILELWDQSIAGNPPDGYYIGTVYSRDQINEALSKPTTQERMAVVPSIDLSGHGTNVAGIAAGNGAASGGVNRGIASESDLLIVKLGIPREDGFPRTTELMQALNWVIERSIYYNKPAAINISFGNTYGAHNGTSLIETFINDISDTGRTSIAIGTGNEGGASGHTMGNFVENEDTLIDLAVSPYELNLSIQLWKNFVDVVDIEIIAPSGSRSGAIRTALGSQSFELDGTQILLYYGEPTPYSTAQEIYIEFLPAKDYIREGIWTIRLVPRVVVDGTYNLWLPSNAVLNDNTRFLYPVPDLTLTIPSTAQNVISVAAYNDLTGAYAPFSGRGYVLNRMYSKPDIAAPGIDILTTAVGGGYNTVSGTSFATPFVTGSAALMLEWGVVQNNDPFLYGEKLKAYLIAGAKPLGSMNNYPNEYLGYGALCLRNTFDRLG